MKTIATVPDHWLQKYLPWAITGIFFLLAAWGLFKHEMWRDEHQAWLLARDSSSFLDLCRNTVYEGSPLLWQFVLWILSKVSSSCYMTQILSLVLGTGTVFLLNRYSPFPLLWKIGISFSNLFFYEYTVISRCYGLGLFLVVVVCTIYHLRFRKPILLAILLFLLANTSVYGLMLSIAITGIVALEFIVSLQENKKSLPAVLTALGIVIAGAGLSIYQIYPEPDNGFYSSLHVSFGWQLMQVALTKITAAYFSFPDITRYDYWNTCVFVNENISLMSYISILLFLLIASIFMNKPLILVLYVLGTTGIVCFLGYAHIMYTRYFGHLFILLVVCLWIARYYKEITFQRLLARWVVLLGTKVRQFGVPVIVLVSMSGGFASWGSDLGKRFSASPDAAQFIREQSLEMLPIVGYEDFVIACLASILNKRDVYYLPREEWGTFIKFDLKRIREPVMPLIVPSLEKIMREKASPVLLVLNFPLLYENARTNERQIITRCLLSENVRIILLDAFTQSVEPNERYFIYAAENTEGVFVEGEKLLSFK